MATPKRFELILKIESMLYETLRISRQMKPGNNSTVETYQRFIRENEKIENEADQLMELVRKLPKENTPEVQKKRATMVDELERKISYSQDLMSRQSSTPGYEDNNLIDLQREIEIHSKILDLL